VLHPRRRSARRLRVADDDGAGGGALTVQRGEQPVLRTPALICECVDSLVARPKSGKIQLVWQPVGTLATTFIAAPFRWTVPQDRLHGVQLLHLPRQPGCERNEVLLRGPAVAVTGDEVCQSNEASATASARLR